MNPCPPSRFDCRAFSLIELLAVIAVISTLAAVSVTSLSSFNRSGTLNVGVVRVMNVLMQARTEAIARNTGVQVRIVVSDPADSSAAGRVFSIWSRKKDGTVEYEQITAWERLPDSVSVLEDAAWFTPGANQEGTKPFVGNNGNAISGVPYRGRTVDTMAIEFSPTGGVRLPKPSETYLYFLLAPTIPSSAGSTLAARTAEVKETQNWRQIRISNLTGQMRVNSPGS